MGREVLRVALDFVDFEIDKVWHGRLMPERLHETPCAACRGDGMSPFARYLRDRWYGKVEFWPEQTGSAPYTADTFEVRALAARNVAAAPGYYGRAPGAVDAEAQRLAAHFNARWYCHLAQADVDALIEAGRLVDFTHAWRDGKWQPIEPPPKVLAADVNRWSLSGIGHDSINQWVVAEACCKAAGVARECSACDGHGSHEAYPGQRAEAEAWQPADPPKGEGWQLWSTTTEGSPMTPVFATPEALAQHCASARVSSFGSDTLDYAAWLRFIAGPGWAPSMISTGGRIMSGVEAAGHDSGHKPSTAAP